MKRMNTSDNRFKNFTTAFGPMKESPSKPPAITLTCLGRPTLNINNNNNNNNNKKNKCFGEGAIFELQKLYNC